MVFDERKWRLDTNCAVQSVKRVIRKCTVLRRQTDNSGRAVTTGKYLVSCRHHPVNSYTDLHEPAGGIPYFLQRCALMRELFDRIIELQPSSTSGGLAENIKCM